MDEEDVFEIEGFKQMFRIAVIDVEPVLLSKYKSPPKKLKELSSLEYKEGSMSDFGRVLLPFLTATVVFFLIKFLRLKCWV